MHYRVKAKQQNTKMCLVCGLKNPFGLQTAFYELESDELLAIFKPMEEHQSYPGRLHGGIATAILDETIGRAIMMICGASPLNAAPATRSRFRWMRKSESSAGSRRSPTVILKGRERFC